MLVAHEPGLCRPPLSRGHRGHAGSQCCSPGLPPLGFFLMLQLTPLCDSTTQGRAASAGPAVGFLALGVGLTPQGRTGDKLGQFL